MALKFLDSFGYYTVLTEKWTTAGNGSIDLTGTRSRTGIGALINSGDGPTLTLFPVAGCVMGAGYNTQALNGDLFGVKSNATRQVRLRVNSDGSVSVITGNDPFPNLLGSSVASLVIPNSYGYWEMKISAFSSSAKVTVRLNGLVVLALIGNTNPAGSGLANGWYLSGPTGGTAALADVYFCDLQDSGIPGQPNTDFLGPMKIYALPPTSDSSPLQWTPNVGFTHFTQVNTVPPNYVNYVADGTQGDVDQYTFSAKPIPNPQTIVGVQVNLDSAADSIVSGVSVAPDVGGIVGGPYAMSTTFTDVRQVYDGNPVNSLPWKIGDFVTVPFGPKVTVGVAPSNKFVSVSDGSTTVDQIQNSPDAITWTGRTSPANSNRSVAVAAGASVVSAIANVPPLPTFIAITSADHGSTWTSHAIPQPGGSPSAIAYQAMTFANSQFVIAAEDGTVATSPDGITWTAAPVGLTLLPATFWYGIAFGAGVYVAVGEGTTNVGIAATSADGVTWTSRTTPAFTALEQHWFDVCFASGQFVAVGNYDHPFGGTGNNVMTSPDGITWTKRTAPVDSWHGIAFGAGLYVAVGAATAGAEVMTSPDGITWTTHSVPDAGGGTATRVRFVNSKFIICMGNNGPGLPAIITSPDGLTWTTQTCALDSVWDVAFG